MRPQFLHFLALGSRSIKDLLNVRYFSRYILGDLRAKKIFQSFLSKLGTPIKEPFPLINIAKFTICVKSKMMAFAVKPLIMQKQTDIQRLHKRAGRISLLQSHNLPQKILFCTKTINDHRILLRLHHGSKLCLKSLQLNPSELPFKNG